MSDFNDFGFSTVSEDEYKAQQTTQVDAAKEVKSGLECGITFKNFLDFKEKDMIESYKVDMIERRIND